MTGKKCCWTEDEDGVWWTDCPDNAFAFCDGGPAENKFRFCPYCGKQLVEAEYRQADE